MVLIRRAVPRDADAIAKLAAQAATEEGQPSALDADRIRAHCFGNAAMMECWVADENRKLVGHAVVTRNFDIRRGTPIIVLCELFVAPDQRRTGLARQLMSAIARRAMDMGARELTITTGVSNAVAQRFFNAVGARPLEGTVFQMTQDGIQWLASEGL